MADGVDIEVDIETLEQSKVWLEKLHGSLVDEFIPKFEGIGKSVGVNAANSPFGGECIASRESLWTKHNTYLRSAYDSYNNIAQTLQNAIDGTQRVIDKYKSAEERNAANVNDLKALMNEGTSATSTTSTSTTSTSTSGDYN